uniref:CUB domain-containing protein n=1 Tax=Strigamia maritima TaxID=126957 RepID=T1IVI7_STRMM
MIYRDDGGSILVDASARFSFTVEQEIAVRVYQKVSSYRINMTSENACFYHFSSSDSKTGNFSSPGFPSSYPSGVDCHYTFEGEAYEGVQIAFTVFDLEPPYKTGCLMDYVDISTINIHKVKYLVGRYCGRHVVSPLVSFPTAEVKFRSNHAIQHSGFFGTYEFLDEKDISPPPSSSDDNVDGCGGSVSGTGGLITSPGYPFNFTANLDCIWLIRVPYTNHIYVRILQLQLHGSIATCQKAALAIYDGYVSLTQTPKPLKSYCGDLKYYKNVDDRNALSHRNRLLISIITCDRINRFTASEESRDTSEEIIGFKIVWTAVSFEDEKLCTQFACRNSHYCVEKEGATLALACKPNKLFCIDESLRCNHLPNCSEGDTSDEDSCKNQLVIILIDSIFNRVYAGDYPYVLVSGIAASAAVIAVSLILCVCRRLSTRSSNGNLPLHLRQLEHSPSCSNRQLTSSFSQPCDLLPPPPTVNGTSNRPGGPYEVIFTSGTPVCPRHSAAYPTQV